jgi:hypothetical protein
MLESGKQYGSWIASSTSFALTTQTARSLRSATLMQNKCSKRRDFHGSSKPRYSLRKSTSPHRGEVN